MQAINRVIHCTAMAHPSKWGIIKFFHCCFCDEFETFLGVTSLQKISRRLLLQLLDVLCTNDIR